MRFPNAAKGVKRLFVAEILAFIAGIAAVAAGILLIAFLISGNTASESNVAGMLTMAGTGLAAGICGLAVFVLAIISFIMNILGLFKASKDEPTFRIALFATFVCIAFSFTGAFFNTIGNTFMQSLMEALCTAFELLMTIYVIQGIRSLAVRLNDGEMDSKGAVIFKLIFLIIVLEFVARVIVVIFGGTLAGTVSAVITLCAAVLSIIQYILYLSYLSKGAKMLANAKA